MKQQLLLATLSYLAAVWQNTNEIQGEPHPLEMTSRFPYKKQSFLRSISFVSNFHRPKKTKDLREDKLINGDTVDKQTKMTAFD